MTKTQAIEKQAQKLTDAFAELGYTLETTRDRIRTIRAFQETNHPSYDELAELAAQVTNAFGDVQRQLRWLEDVSGRNRN